MDRMTRQTAISYFEHPLTNAVQVEAGELACVDTDTGLLVKGGVDPNYEPIGYFEKAGTGDGSTKFRVRLFKEVWVHWWANDTGGTPVAAADVLSDCFIHDDRTVSGDGTGKSVAGRVWLISSTYGVGVQMKGF